MEGRFRAFTLIEILIVVVILGILAAIVVVNVASAATQTREVVLKTLLDQMHEQIETFRQRHSMPPGIDPDTGSPSETAFVGQMTRYLDVAGRTSDTKTGAYVYGPYLAQMPTNPTNGKASVLMVDDGEPLPAADNSTGWIYKPETGQFYANHPNYGPGVDW